MWPLSSADGAEIPEPPRLAPSSLMEPGIGLGPAEPGAGWGALWAGSPRDGRTRQRMGVVAGGCLPGLCPPPQALGPVLPSPPECRGLYRGGLSAATSWAAGPALIPGDSAGTCWHGPTPRHDLCLWGALSSLTNPPTPGGSRAPDTGQPCLPSSEETEPRGWVLSLGPAAAPDTQAGPPAGAAPAPPIKG